MDHPASRRPSYGWGKNCDGSTRARLSTWRGIDARALAPGPDNHRISCNARPSLRSRIPHRARRFRGHTTVRGSKMRKAGRKSSAPRFVGWWGGEEFLNLHQNFEQPEAKGIVKTIRLPIPKRLSVWHRPASVSNRRCCRDVSRLGQWLSVLNGEHDQEIRLDRFLRRFHYRQHAAAALGR